MSFDKRMDAVKACTEKHLNLMSFMVMDKNQIASDKTTRAFQLYEKTKPGDRFCIDNGDHGVFMRKPLFYVYGFRTENALYLYNGDQCAMVREDLIEYFDLTIDHTHPDQIASGKDTIKKGMIDYGLSEFIDSHYDYLEIVLPIFELLLEKKYGREFNLCGFIVSHGDKAYGYRVNWEKGGIPFNQGVLLFLLTYTNLMDLPKQESVYWVIKNHPEYLPLIKEAEEIAGFR